MTIGSAVYIGTDGSGPGGQWVRTRSGWRLSESEDSDQPATPTKSEVQDMLGKHIKRASNKIIMEKASGMGGAPPSRAGPSENLSYLPIITRTTPESGYTTLGEAIRRLNFVEAVNDEHKFNYVFRVLEMTVKHKLLSLSGSSIRRLFAIMAKLCEVMEQRSHFDRRERLQAVIKMLEKKLSTFVKELSCSHSAVESCINQCQHLHSLLQNLKVKAPEENEEDLTITELPVEVRDKIMLSLSQGFYDFFCLKIILTRLCENSKNHFKTCF